MTYMLALWTVLIIALARSSLLEAGVPRHYDLVVLSLMATPLIPNNRPPTRTPRRMDLQPIGRREALPR